MVDKTSILELLRVVLTVWPQTPQDLMQVEWPCTPEGESKIILHLADAAQNPGWGWRINSWAYDYLETLVRESMEKGEPGSIPLELAAWSHGVVAGKVKRPHAPVGRDPSANAMRDAKFDFLETVLRLNGHTAEAAINLIAEAACKSEEAVASAIKKRRKLAKRTHDEMLNSGTNIWGEQIN